MTQAVEVADRPFVRPAPGRRPKVLAVASNGGHWVQLMRVVPAFEGSEIVFASVDPVYRSQVGGRSLHVVHDANRWGWLGCLRLAASMLRVVVRERPDVVFSTGAAPGFFAIFFGRLLGARTIWLDSIANVERMSLSGQLVRPFASLWLTQWREVADAGGAEFAGKVF